MRSLYLMNLYLIKNIRKNLALPIACTLGLLWCLNQPSAQAGNEATVGRPAPNFSLTDMHGKKVSLSDFKGKTLVLEWLNHGCPYVKKHYDSEFKNMQSLQKKYVDKGIVWLSIVSSRAGKQGHMNAKKALDTTEEVGAHPTTVLLDADGSVGKLYGAKTTPHMFVISDDGRIAYEGAIDDKPTTKLSSLKDAKNYVSSALDAIMKKEPIEVSYSKPYGCSVKY